MAPSGLPQRGSLAQLARDTVCVGCGQRLRDPVLLPCEHSCCRRCLQSSRDPGTPPELGAPFAVRCPRCYRPCAPGRLRTPRALAVESRIAQRLAGTPAPQRRPRGGSLGAQLRADAAAPPHPPTLKETPKMGGGEAATPPLLMPTPPPQ
ncbi:RING finger protein 39-like [Cuculus canorus]|uniref:RING finger protein 39-like n=1 Tax=Cuculus canorus TaxID=55661 RepID=UPI0023AAD64C|nr:RING finger protein 39-like [Cuculus canorus]